MFTRMVFDQSQRTLAMQCFLIEAVDIVRILATGDGVGGEHRLPRHAVMLGASLRQLVQVPKNSSPYGNRLHGQYVADKPNNPTSPRGLQKLRRMSVTSKTTPRSPQLRQLARCRRDNGLGSASFPPLFA